jgi:hypothetical protein
MLVISQETGNWRLWVVPADEKIDKREFYRIVADTISQNEITGIDVGSVELARSDNPAMLGTSKIMNQNDGIGGVSMSSNTYKGILLPDGVVIRMDL